MKILLPMIHPGFTCMLCKRSPHEFFVRRVPNYQCRVFPGDWWDDAIRPKPPNLRILAPDDPFSADVAIRCGGAGEESIPAAIPTVHLHLWDSGPFLPACTATVWVFLSAEVAAMHGAANNPRTRVIHYGFDAWDYADWTGNGSVVAIGHFLRARSEKGYQNLVEINRHVPLTLLGYGNDEFKNHQFINDYEAFMQTLRTAAVYVNPSPWVPLSAIEMMLLGVPTVQFTPRQYRDVFHDHMNCRIVATPMQAVAAIRALTTDRMTSRRLGRNARADIMNTFPIDRFLKQWNEVFDLAAYPSKSKT